MDETMSDALQTLQSRWEALATREQGRLTLGQEYDAGNQTVLDRLETLQSRAEALDRGTEERQQQRDQGMSH
jgi:hypothetical protein